MTDFYDRDTTNFGGDFVENTIATDAKSVATLLAMQFLALWREGIFCQRSNGMIQEFQDLLRQSANILRNRGLNDNGILRRSRHFFRSESDVNGTDCSLRRFLSAARSSLSSIISSYRAYISMGTMAAMGLELTMRKDVTSRGIHFEPRVRMSWNVRVWSIESTLKSTLNSILAFFYFHNRSYATLL